MRHIETTDAKLTAPGRCDTHVHTPLQQEGSLPNSISSSSALQTVPISAMSSNGTFSYFLRREKANERGVGRGEEAQWRSFTLVFF